MQEVKVVELLPNGMTKVDLGNDTIPRQSAAMGRMLNDLAARICDCERCQKWRADQPNEQHGQ